MVMFSDDKLGGTADLFEGRKALLRWRKNLQTCLTPLINGMILCLYWSSFIFVLKAIIDE